MATKIIEKRGRVKTHLSIKRAELIWSLREQGYSNEDIGAIFNVSKQRIQFITTEMPKGWKSPWIKIK